MSFDLSYRERPPRKSVEGKAVCLVLLHGYGSNEQDLLGLTDQLDPSLHVISVQAPHRIGSEQYAWFELDWQPSGIVPTEDQALESCARLSELLRELPERCALDPRLLLAGFSQGAMMTFGVAMRAPDILRRFAMMSGRILPAFVPEEKGTPLEGMPVLVQHGLQDQVLPYQGSLDAAALLKSLGAEVRHVEYCMGHEVSLESLADLRAFLVP